MLLAQELGVSLDWLVLGKTHPRPRSDVEPHAATDARGGMPAVPDSRGIHRQVRHLPVISWSCVARRHASGDHQPDSDVYLPCPRPCGPRSFALKTQGDSMYPAYLDGEYIFVDPDIEPGHNRDVILLTGNGASFRRLQLAPDGHYLLAINPDHPQRMLQMGRDCTICGVVIASYMER